MEVTSGQDRRADLHHRLVYETDTLARAGIHLELAALAVADGRFDSAAQHFREALVLDAKLDRAKEGLRGLGEKIEPARATGKGGVRRLWNRLRGRTAG